MISVSMFGATKNLDFYFNAKSAIKRMEELKKSVPEPQIIGGFGYDVISLNGYRDYDYDSTVSSDIVVSYALSKLGWNGNDLFDAILSHSVEDIEETKRINKGYTGIYNRMITLSDEVQKIIITEADRVIAEISDKLKEEANKKDAAKAKYEADKAALLSGVKWTTEQKTVYDEGGKTVEYTHTIIINGGTFQIKERNVFDFGRVLNGRGGMYSRDNGKWVLQRLQDKNGWISEPISSDEEHAVEIVHRYGEYANADIRM